MGINMENIIVNTIVRIITSIGLYHLYPSNSLAYVVKSDL